MKINTPVTRTEVHLQPGKPIVSKTDLKGAITYVNQNFVDISGYSREELLGNNHNIVRHPDMPPEAFAWLWRTIKQGLPWRGMVKNRCKNGDFYWVEAYVTPIRENGKVTGYMSVRNAPARDEVNAAEALYANIRNGRASLPDDRETFRDISLFTKLNVIFSSMFLLLGGSSAYYLSQADSAPDYLVAAITGTGTLLTIVASLWLRFAVKRFLTQSQSALAQIAEGNFAFTVGNTNRDEFGMLLQDIESMRINLRAIIADVSLAARKVDTASQHVAQDMHHLLQRSTEQSDRVNSVSAATEEIHQSIANANELTGVASRLSGETTQIVRQGQLHMNNSIESVDKIVEVVNESRSAIANLHDATQRIGQISLTIKEVAEQTNLLALNAAIEAARAGEQGRGFAVVADEVRKLAERTSSSTLDISKTVENIKEITSSATQAMDQAVSEVGRGTQLIHGSKQNLDEILAASDKQLEMSKEVTLMLAEQAAATEDIAGNMTGIFNLASDNVDDIRKTGSVTENLAHTAAELEALVRHFEKSL